MFHTISKPCANKRLISGWFCRLKKKVLRFLSHWFPYEPFRYILQGLAWGHILGWQRLPVDRALLWITTHFLLRWSHKIFDTILYFCSGSVDVEVSTDTSLDQRWSLLGFLSLQQSALMLGQAIVENGHSLGFLWFSSSSRWSRWRTACWLNWCQCSTTDFSYFCLHVLL